MVKDLKEVLKEDFWIMPATPKYINKGIPYITSKNIKNGKIDFENVNYIDIEDYRKISKNRPILVDDILISMIGTIGETAIVKEKDGAFYGQNMFLVRLDENKIYQRYFINYFKSNIVKRQLINKQNKSTQSYLKASHIESLKIPIPELNEQKKIANILDKVQEIIELRKRQIEELEELIKSQFVQMFGNPFDNSKWKIKKLGEVAESIYDGTNIPPKYYQKEEKVLFLRIQNVWRNEFRLEDSVYVSEEINKKYIDTSLKKGDLLITKIGRYYTKESSLGRVAIYLGENNKANYSNNIMRIRVKNEINSEFLNILLNLEDYQLYIRRESKGGTDKRALSKKVIENFPIIIPPLEMQNQFIKFVKQMNNQKSILEKSLKETEELQESLMNIYFGE